MNPTEHVAVYGTLRRGCGNDRFLKGAPMLGQYEVRSHRMYTSHGAYPYVHYSPTGTITVEVYDVTDPRMMKDLDMLEGYPHHYQRKVVPYFDNNKTRTPAGRAWMYYVIDEGEDHDYIETGNWHYYVYYAPKSFYSNRKSK